MVLAPSVLAFSLLVQNRRNPAGKLLHCIERIVPRQCFRREERTDILNSCTRVMNCNFIVILTEINNWGAINRKFIHVIDPRKADCLPNISPDF